MQSAKVSGLDLLLIILGTLFTLFLPGFIWSFVFFSETVSSTDDDLENIDMLERIAISVGLSLALVPTTLFIMNYLFDIKIDLNSTLVVLIMIIIIGIFAIRLRNPEVIRRFIGRIKGALIKTNS